MPRDVTSYHSHSDLLKLLVEMDPIRSMVERDTKKFKIILEAWWPETLRKLK